MVRRSTGARLAYAVFATHVLATLAMALFLRHGLPDALTTPADRLAFIRTHAVSWCGGWLLWQLAALALISLYAHLGMRWWSRAPGLVAVALVCAAAAIGCDVAGQSLYMGMPSHLDAAGQEQLEIAAGLISGYAANGLYTVAGVLLTLAGLGDLPRRIVAASVLLWISGFALAFATVSQAIFLQQVTTAAMLASLFLWSLMLARWLRNES